MSELALIQEFERRLGAAGGTLPELTELRDRGHALLELFRRRRAMLDDKNALTLRLIEVERQISLYLAGLPRSPGGRPAQNSFHRGTSFSEEAPTFEDAIQNVGLSRTTAWRIQTLALVPEVDLQAHVHAIIADGKELTLKAVYDLAQPLAAQQREQERQAELTVQLARFHATVEVDLERQITRQDAADLQNWGDGELDVLLTSPPYATGQPYAGGGDVDPDAYPDCVRAWVAEMFRVMHPEHGRALVVVPFDTSWLPVSALWQMALVQAGFKYRPSGGADTGSGKNHAKARGTNVRVVTRARNPLIRPHAPSETRQFGHLGPEQAFRRRAATCGLDESRIFADQGAGLGGSSRTKAP